MPLDPQFLPVLEAVADLEAFAWAQADAPSVRARGDIPWAPQIALPTVQVSDIAVSGADGKPLPARLYRPTTGVLPVTIFFHGGGWVMGTLDTHDALCRVLADASGCAIVSVAYRLAPEHPFPAPLEDCYAAVQSVHSAARALRLDGARMAVAGDSAGGNLAAAVAILTRERGGAPLTHQLLLYPVADRDFETESYRLHGTGYFLTAEGMRWLWTQYVGGAEPAPALAAICRVENLAGLAPATVITAEFDPLRDEGERYALRLAQAGVPVELVRAPGAIHGFVAMLGAVDIALVWAEHAAARLRTALAAAP